MSHTARDAFEIAQRFIGVKEIAGLHDSPIVLAMLQLDQSWPEHDEIAWCSAFVNFICWLCGLPRTKQLNARSWLTIGIPVPVDQAEVGDIVVLRRGDNPALGHVGFFAGAYLDDQGPPMGAQEMIELLAGNQGNQVSVKAFPASEVVGIRRLVP